MDVKGKAVFLTGGAQGIGHAVCTALLNKGAKVFFCDLKAEKGKATEAELQNQYGADKVMFAQCDVTDADQFKGVFSKAVEVFGAVDICVNNAGLSDERLMEKMMEVNAIATIRGCQLALEHMRRDKGGKGGVIISTSSIAGLGASYPGPVYAASKHAIIGFAQSWATNPKMKEMGVRWGVVCPGPVETEMVLSLEEDKMVDYENSFPHIQALMTKPEVVAEAFMSLVEDENSNGALMVVVPGLWGIKYRKRQLVDSDGKSNPAPCDIFSA